MIFEEGKTYMHTTGKKMKIVGAVDSYIYGKTLIGENIETGEFIPVGRTKYHAENWKEVVD